MTASLFLTEEILRGLHRIMTNAAEAFLRSDAGSVTVAEGPGHHRDTELLVHKTGLAD